ncbi:MAG: hypothetical protein R3B06_03365 [Kofleriaceae bacterium]
MASSLVLDAPEATPRAALRPVTLVVLAVTAVVFGAMMIYGAWATEGSAVGAALGTALVAAGAVAAGTVIGFLFGIPSELTVAAPDRAGPPSAAPVPAVAPSVSPARSNQLVLVAEWLTRILLGATLTQLGTVRDLVQELGEQASGGILGHQDGMVVMVGVIVYAAVFGFFVGHLCTRLILNALFRDADAPQALGRLRTALGTDGSDGGTGKSFDGISSTVAELVVERDVRELADPEDQRAWGLARLKTSNRDAAAVSAAVSALTRSFVARPNDRAAVQSLVLGLLYQDGGYDRAIDEARRFLASEATAEADNANLYAYLACGYGQRYAALPATATAERAAAAAATLDAARTAIARDPSWKLYLGRLATAPAGSTEDDLTAVAHASPELRQLLGIDPAAASGA